MKIPDTILALIDDEQKRQHGAFVPEDAAYLDKLSRHAELLIHQDANCVLGFVFFYCNASDKKASYITLISTSFDSRGKGVGYGLVQHVLMISKKRGFSCCQLEVRKENTSVIDFYKQVGFVTVEDRSDKFLMSIKVS